MGIKDWFKSKNNQVKANENFKMITSNNSGIFSWNGNLYHSDIVRSAIRPKAQAVGKAVPKHIQEKDDGDDKENPKLHIRFLLEEPNPYMTMQMFIEKMVTQLELNSNAFAYVQKDNNGEPMELYPIVAAGVQQLQDENNKLYLRFTRENGQSVTFKYSDIIHLRKDYNSSELFGESNGQALTNLMEVINTVDQGLVKAVKNSNIIKWLLKFHTAMKPEHIKQNTKQFEKDFLDVENSDGVGAAGIDNKMEAERVSSDSYVPEHENLDKIIQRVYGFFNTNEKIVKGEYTEDEYISYFETSIQPIIKQMSEEFTRKLFSRRQRARGHKVVFNSESLQFASMETKLGLTELIDRGAMSINEFRKILNMPPVEHGNEYLRRLDTAKVEEDNSGKGGGN